MSDLLPALDEDGVRRLLREAAPVWSHLPVRRLASTGTDNAVFRLGEAQVLRIPRRVPAVRLLAKELDWLPRLAGLPLEVPRLRYRGRADLGCPCDFGILDWIEGRPATPEAIADPAVAARDLARFLAALHCVGTSGAPRAGADNARRGVPLADLEADTRRAIAGLADEIDARAARALWETACAAPGPAAPVWLHGDLKSDNLIARDGALRGVIDWGLAAVGDPAADHAAAWAWVDPAARDAFRAALDLGAADWLRAQGWALYGAVIALAYYRGGGNRALCRQSRRTLARLGLMV